MRGLVLLLLTAMAALAQSQPTPIYPEDSIFGGVHEESVTAHDIMRFVDVAMALHNQFNSMSEEDDLQVDSILSASTQVVAGVMYRATFLATNKGASKRVICEAEELMLGSATVKVTCKESV